MAELLTDDVRVLLETARKSGYAEVEIGVGDDRFRAVLGPRPKRAAAAKAEDAAPAESFVRATMVGYLRRPVEAGTDVSVGSSVASIEALDIPNPLESDVEGRLEEWLVEDGSPVHYGQPVARVVPR